MTSCHKVLEICVTLNHMLIHFKLPQARFSLQCAPHMAPDEASMTQINSMDAITVKNESEGWFLGLLVSPLALWFVFVKK